MLVLEGHAAERGRQHGEALRDEVRASLCRFLDDAAIRTGLPGARYVEQFLADTDFVGAIRAHTPALLEELSGIAEGAGVPPEQVLAYNFLDEEWWYSETLRSKCSALAVPARDGQPALVAQTMDLPLPMDGGQVLLRHRDPDGREVAVLSAAGLIGLTGASSGRRRDLRERARHAPARCPRPARRLRAARRAGAADGPRRSRVHPVGPARLRPALRGGRRRRRRDRPRVQRRWRDGVGRRHRRGSSTRTTRWRARTRSARAPRARPGGELAPPPGRARDPRPAGLLARGRARAARRPHRADLRSRADRSAWVTFGAVVTKLGDTVTMDVALGPPDETPWLEVELSR